MLMNMKDLLAVANEHKFAVPAFNISDYSMMNGIFEASEEKQAPVIIAIHPDELKHTGTEIVKAIIEKAHKATVPVCIHLDHGATFEQVMLAIQSGFTSVMIDGSSLSFEDNIAVTREVVEYAHAKKVEVEAELGKIGATDKIETDNDESLYTDPAEAEEFVARTGVDTLAVSIGTAHGVYPVKNPRIDLERLARIRERVSIPLVLHGGSGLPPETVQAAITIPGGGVSKINIATDLEQAFLGSLGCERKSNREIWQMDKDALAKAGEAVQQVVEDKIRNFLLWKA